MKKSTLLKIILVQILAPCLLAQTATPPASGDGSVGDPYQINTLENLYWLSQNANEWDKNFIQTDDIDASETNTWDVGDHDANSGTPDEAMGFSSIGTGVGGMSGGIPFIGSYNGKGHTVSNMYINRPIAYHIGLFGCTAAGFIDSLGLINVNIHGGQYHIGGLVGACYSGSTILHCYSTGSVVGSYNSVGGLIGFNSGSTVHSCYSFASATGSGAIGGLIGAAQASAVINNCYSIGTVTGTGSAIGGLIGNNSTQSTVDNCYSTGIVNGNTFAGGFIGYNDGIVNNCFWDTFWGQATSAAGMPKDHVEMKTLTTFTNATWDFLYETTNGTNDYWRMPCGGGNYPRLSWQDNSIFSASGTDTRTECGSIVWIDGNTYTANNNTATHTIIAATAFGCDSIVTLDLTIVNNISDLTTSTSGSTITANNTVASYVWLDCDNNNAVIAGEIGQSFTASASGNYAVQLTENTCVDTSLCVAISLLGSEEINFGFDFIIYPNPIKDYVYLSFGQLKGEKQVSIVDASGRVIGLFSTDENKYEIDMSSYESGIYLLNIQNKNEQGVQRIIKF